MLLGCIADDFTGATDLAITLRRQGLGVVQVSGVPRPDLALPAVDAIVVALKSRTMPSLEACRLVLAAHAWLQARGAQRFYFKYCSTFDSTPAGNIGPVTDALADVLDADLVPSTPAYPRNQRTVYLGHLFVGTQLLSDSGMRHHPLTPMDDANLVRVLQAQTPRPVGLVTAPVVEMGASAIAAEFQTLRSQGIRHAIVDAITDTHLLELGKATVTLRLAAGGAGLAMGIASQLSAGARGHADVPLRPVGGPVVMLAGSCSTATLAQIAAIEDSVSRLRIDPVSLAHGPAVLDGLIEQAKACIGRRPVLITSSEPADALLRIQQQLGLARAASLVEDAFRRIARELAAMGVRRFVVAGGETAGAVVEALSEQFGFQSLTIGAEIAPGVPWTVSVDGEPVALALKSGNFGGTDFFRRALACAP